MGERVTARDVREFYGAMAAGGAPHGMLFTTGNTQQRVDYHLQHSHGRADEK